MEKNLKKRSQITFLPKDTFFEVVDIQEAGVFRFAIYTQETTDPHLFSEWVAKNSVWAYENNIHRYILYRPTLRNALLTWIKEKICETNYRTRNS